MSAPSTVNRGLMPSVTTLDNGVRVTVKPTRKTPAVALNLSVRAGSVCDPMDGEGAVNLLARVMDRGTTSRSATEIAEYLDGRGVALTTFVNLHACSLTCSCLAEDFDGVLALLGDLIRVPSVPAMELEKRRHEVVTAIRQDRDNPAYRAVESLMSLLYGSGHPYGRSIKGSVESVERLTREDLLALHRERFAPSALSVVVVGDVEGPRVVELAAAIFGGWQVPPPAPTPLPRVEPSRERRRVVVPMMNKVHTDIAYGFTTLTRSDPEYYACWLMNNALGQYAMGGRIGDSIRERQGMAYYASSVLDASLVEGPLMIRAGVSAANVERAVASIDEELDRLRRDGLSEREVRESRQYLVGSLPRALETNAGIATFLQTASFFDLGPDYDERLPGLLARVTIDDANAAARRFVDPARATVVIAGPYEEPASG